MNKLHNIYTEHKTYYTPLIKLGVPIIIGQLGIVATGLADTVMVGQHSTDELAASSFVNNIIGTFLMLGTGYSFNLTPMIGRNLATGKKSAIGGWLKNSLIANTFVALLICSILAVIYTNVEALRQPEELLPLIRPYFVISAVSLVFVMLYNSFRQFVEGISDPTVSMWALLIGNVLNIAGNYILIYGKLGFPELGLNGAGISTFVSRFITLVIFVAVFLYRSKYRPYRHGFILFRINAKQIKRLNAIGWPIGLQQGIEASTFSVTAIMVGWLGSAELAAHQVVIAISNISFVIYLGLSSAVAIRSSYYKGAGDWKSVIRNTVSGVHLALVASTIICIILFLTRARVGHIFTDDIEVNLIIVLLIPMLILYQLSDSVQLVLVHSLRGLADVKAIMWISFCSYFFGGMLSGYVFGFVFKWGITGIWMAFPLGFLCCGILLWKRTRMLVNKNLKNE